MREFDALREFLYRRMRGHETAPDAGSAPGRAATARAAPGAAGAREAEREGEREGEMVALLREIRTELEATRRALETR